ncbi:MULTISPECIES: TetR/AcrR family transcriptional regulator [Kordiimonas]|uniref:Transcriptional regulator, TetR family n=1 Tax=Kordiimonas lacus TaxID=637679 RepID=A0A1G7DLQ7_9PROT|nr:MULTISPECIES: TetR/AcrR family transcriptional regulator [Kordiimonas]SDE52432.1 transcriptional regulator, TetR family [Kordiimonas lacus]
MSNTAVAHQDAEDENKPARGRPRDVEKNSAIIDAASQLFLENGFDGTSMDEVAKRAGVSKQTVYSHFSSKEQLFADSIHITIEKYFPDQALQGLETHTLEGDLTVVATKFARLLMSQDAMAMHRVLVAAAGRGPALAKIFWEAGPAEMIVKLSAFLKVWVDRGELDIDDLEKAAGRLVSLLKGKLHFEMSIGLFDSVSDDVLKAHVDDVVDCFLQLYRKK